MQDSGFDGPVWSRSVENPKEEGVERVIKAVTFAVVTGVVEASGVNMKHMGVFLEVL